MNMIKQTHNLLLLILLLFSSVLKSSELYIPPSLENWTDWVLDNKDNIHCPFDRITSSKQCIWPGKLQLQLNQQQKTLSFKQKFTVYGDSKISLPGGEYSWPQHVKVKNLDNQQTVTAIVLSHQSGGMIRPYIYLNAGSFVVSGRFQWQHQLNSIPLSTETVLYEVSRPHQTEPDYGNLDNRNILWFSRQKTPATANTAGKNNNTIDIQTFRKISDGIPLLMESFYRIKVSGQPREIIIDDVISPDFLAYSYSSQLPLRLHKQSSLAIQVKPGTWTFKVTSRAQSSLSTINYFSKADNEIWVFEQDLALQQVQASSAQSIDPSQTMMPQAWRKLPAFYMQKGSVLTMNLKKRGNNTPPANNLSLNKKLWLDFSGRGFTIEDTIQGQMNRGWRLNSAPLITPGRVTLNNQPQLITRSDDAKAGVEIKNGRFKLIAESRIENQINHIPASGWMEDFKSLKATLYLPPGWSIFYAEGIDKLSRSWVNQWTLLDLFQTLLFSIIFYRLWGWKWGITALAGFVLLAHRPDAPVWIWLHILVAIALLKLINQNKLHRFLLWYKNMALIILILILIPFWVDEVRTAIYPQLNIHKYHLSTEALTSDKQSGYDQIPVMAEPAAAEALPMVQSTRKLMKPKMQASNDNYYSREAALKNINRYDPNAKIQTGPGLPSWSFSPLQLNWTGPVTAQQTIQLYYITPKIHLVLTLLMMLISALLLFRLIKNKHWTWPRINAENNSGSQNTSCLIPVFLSIIAAGGSLAFPGYADSSELSESDPLKYSQSAYPPKHFLDDLEQRLLRPEKCHPDCSAIDAVHITIKQQQLFMRLQINSAAFSSVPLPLDLTNLSIEQILLNNQPLDNYRPASDNNYRQPAIALDKGQHQVSISARIKSDQIVLPITMATHNFSYQLNHWSINGLKNYQPVSNQIILQRLKADKQAETPAAGQSKQTGINVPVFVKITRHFYLDQDWTIETRVSRLSDQQKNHSQAVIFEYPLLQHESVISADKKVTNHHITINLSPTENSFSWRSRLKQTEQLSLTAADNADWIEQWQIHSNPIWHIEHQGIPPIQHTGSGMNYLPVWRPWPGETLQLNITKPEALAGTTRTITQSQLQSSYGKKLSEHHLTMYFNSSQGGQHKIKLADKSEVLSLSVSGKQIAIDEKQALIEIPLTAGKQGVSLKWRELRPLDYQMTSLPIDLGMPSVNAHQQIKIPNDRWVIYTAGPKIGPVVLFWGILLVLIFISVIISKIPGLPLTTLQALLLTIGLAPVSIWSLLIVLGWFMMMQKRKSYHHLSPVLFNLMQLILIAATLTTLIVFIYTIQSGLLGYPDMQIAGNDSSAYQLNWYQDRTDTTLPTMTVISLPIYWYRILMLIWSLWLAFIAIRWSIWAWNCYSHDTYWKKITWKRKAIMKWNQPQQQSGQSEQENS